MTTPLHLTEARYTLPTPSYIDTPCPHCQQLTLHHSPIPCPDNIPGFLVAHFGYLCDSCRTVFIGNGGKRPLDTPE